MIMPNSLREKFASGAPTLGTHFLSPDPDIPEIIGDSGLFDYGEFCAEYSTFDMNLLYHLARAGQCADLPLMIKPDQKNQGFWAQAALGAGFKAILFTDIRSVNDVEACHQSIRPDTPDQQGLMGVKLRRTALAGYQAEGYLEDLQSILILIMIEKDIAVDNLDAILGKAKELGVDMTQWGPTDFSFSRGQLSLEDSPEIRTFEELVIRKSIEYGVPPRIEITDVESAQRYIDLGVRHFCIGWDRFIYQAAVAQIGQGMRKLLSTL